MHRLIQTKTDQIVELPALSSAVFDSRSGGPGPTEAAQQSKIEAISEEFGHLVASQLDSQRNFYEKEIEMLKTRLEESEEVTQLERDRARLERKAEKAVELSRRFESELREEQALGVGMRAKLVKLESERETSERRTKALEEEVGELRDQLRDGQCCVNVWGAEGVNEVFLIGLKCYCIVMFFLDAQAKIEHEGGEEMRGGTIVTNSTSAQVPVTGGGGKSGRRKKK